MLKLGLDSFSFNLHLEHPEDPKDIGWFLDQVLELGLDGMQIDPRHLLGWNPDILQKAALFCSKHSLYLELGTGGLGFEDISRKLDMAARAGARTLRTFYGGHRHQFSSESLQQAIADTTEGLKRLGDVAASCGVILALENHEEFTSLEIVQMLQAVDHPFVRACLDTGNGMMVGEDALECTDNLTDYAACVHLKDWVVRWNEDIPQWEDRPLGTGDARAAEVFQMLRTRCPHLPITIENPTWGASRKRSRQDEMQNIRQSIAFLRALACLVLSPRPGCKPNTTSRSTRTNVCENWGEEVSQNEPQ